jgi:hypothetical protein
MILIFGCIFAYIGYGIMIEGFVDYVIVFASLITSILVCGVDFHWSNVTTFYGRHPDERPFKMFNGPLDDEPQYAFQLHEREVEKLD